MLKLVSEASWRSMSALHGVFQMMLVDFCQAVTWQAYCIDHGFSYS